MTVMKAEFHVHTRFSGDSLLPLWALRLRCMARGIECIAITDHNQVEGAQRCREKYPKLHVIVGEEIFTSEGEVIGLFLQERIPPGLTAEQTIEQIKKQGGVVWIPHPCDRMRSKSVLRSDAYERLLDKIDCVEEYNGRTRLEEDICKQRELAESSGAIKVVGSDAHTFFELGRTYMLLDKVPQRDDLTQVLSSAEVRTKPCMESAHRVTKVEKAVRMILAGHYKELLQKIMK